MAPATSPVPSAPITTEPFTAEPFTTVPVTADPFTAEPVTTEPFTAAPVNVEPFPPIAAPRPPAQQVPEFPVAPVPAVPPRAPQPAYAIAGDHAQRTTEAAQPDQPYHSSLPTMSDADLASSALSELRGLYEPSFTPVIAPTPVGPGNLTRRTRRAEVDEPPEEAPAAPRRNRNPADVRGMLSGFRAGVERGRTAPSDAGDGTEAPDSTS